MRKQHNPGRGLVDLKKTPGRLINRDTGRTIEHAVWADLDAGAYVYEIWVDGLPQVDHDRNVIRTAKGHANLSFEPASLASQEVAAPSASTPVIEEATPEPVLETPYRPEDMFNVIETPEMDTQESE